MAFREFKKFQVGPFLLEKSGFYPGDVVNGKLRMYFTIDETCTFQELLVLRDYMGSDEISFENCEHGYYGDHESARVVVTMPVEKVEQWLLTPREVEERQAREKADHQRFLEAKLKEDAQRLGFTLKKGED